MKPSEVVSLKAHLAEMTKEKSWEKFLNLQLNLGERVRLSGGTDEEIQKANELQEWITHATIENANKNECFFIKDEMSDLILFASQKLEKTDKIDLSLVPTDSGFSYFEKPLEYVNTHGEKSLINLVLWKKVFLQDQFGLFMTFWNDNLATPDEKGEWQKGYGTFGRFTFIDYKYAGEGTEVLDEVIPLSEEQLERHRKYSEGLRKKLSDVGHEYPIEEGKEYFSRTNLVRIVWSYFLLMSQTLTEVSTHKFEGRAERRKLERSGVPTDFVIVQFRKRRYLSAETDETKEESAREWSHRWIVGGHWRWQPYKDPVSKGVIHKRIWISPFVKGPGDKPLIAKSRIFVLAK